MKEIFYNIYVNRAREIDSETNIFLDYIRRLLCFLQNDGPLCFITADISNHKFVLESNCVNTVSIAKPCIHIAAESDDMDRLDTAIEQVSEHLGVLASEKIYGYGELCTPYDYTHRNRDTESFVDIEVKDTPNGKTILVNSSVPVSRGFSEGVF